ncbi:hypothetical protein D3C71_1260840 [compost metagenome]
MPNMMQVSPTPPTVAVPLHRALSMVLPLPWVLALMVSTSASVACGPAAPSTQRLTEMIDWMMLPCASVAALKPWTRMSGRTGWLDRPSEPLLNDQLVTSGVMSSLRRRLGGSGEAVRNQPLMPAPVCRLVQVPVLQGGV